MKKISRKLVISIIMVVVILGLATGSTFLGIYLYRRYTPDVRYARAESNWSEASHKKAVDDVAVEIVLGAEGNSITAVFQFEGERIYNENNIEFNYEVEIIARDLPLVPVASVLTLSLNLISDGNESALTISKIDGMIDFETIEETFTKEELRDIDITMSSLSIYNDNDISIDKEGNFSIQGIQSIDFMLASVDRIISEFVDIDLAGILSSYANIGRVRGVVKYNKDFVVSSITSTQSISFFAPWTYLDTLVAEMDLPENIMEMYQERKITIKDIPIINEYTIDFNDYLPDGILANIRIIGDTSFQIIKK